MKRFTLATVLTLLSGCATTAPYQPMSVARYQEMLSIWNGKDINDLIYVWGPPTSTFTMPNGNKMFTWANVKIGPTITTGESFGQSHHNEYLGNTFGFGSANSVSVTSKWDCYTTAVTNSTGTIISWQLKGNDCLLAYTDSELKKKSDEINAKCATLKKGDHIRLTFFDGARDEYSTTFAKNYEGYFSSYSKTGNRRYGSATVSISPKIETGFFQLSNEDYPLKYIEDIAVLEQAEKEAPRVREPI